MAFKKVSFFQSQAFANVNNASIFASL